MRAGVGRCRLGSSRRRSRRRRSRGWDGGASTCCWRSTAARTLVMHLRMTGNLVLVEGEEKLDPSEGRRLYEAERSTSERHLRARFTLDDGRELWFTDPRRFGEAIPGRRREAGRALRQARRRAALRRVHPGGAGRDGGGTHGAAEVLPARPVRRRRGRQHLRRRGALPRAPAPALAGRLDEARAPARRSATLSSPRWKRGSTAAAPRSTTTATVAARRARCRTSSSSTPARASPARAAAAAISRIVVSRPLDLLLPELPGAPAQRRPKARGAVRSRRSP